MKISKKILLENENEYRDILLVNMQPSMQHRMSFDPKDFGKWLDSNGDKFISIYYFFNGEGEDVENNRQLDITKWFSTECGINDGFTPISRDISELPDYFDGLLESNYTDDDITAVFKYILGNNYDKLSNGSPDEISKLNISDEFKEELMDGKYKLEAPHKLTRLMDEMRNPMIVGGLKHNTIRILTILFNAIGKKFTTSNTYMF